MATPHQASGLRTVMGLYRTILRLHRDKLQGDMKDLGNSYVRAEFQAHLQGKNRPSSEQWMEFVQQWRGYVAMLSPERQQAEHVAKATLHTAENLSSYMSPEQQLRMESLKKEAGSLGASILKKGQSSEEADLAPGGGESAKPLQ